LPASLIRRRTYSLAGVVLALVVLTGCPYQRDPGSYGDSVREDFVAGCDGSAFEGREDQEALQDPSVTLETERCAEVYDCLTEVVDFDDFRDINSSLRDDPAEPLPEGFRNSVRACYDDPGAAVDAVPPTTEG
jgi:hypothetical protein